MPLPNRGLTLCAQRLMALGVILLLAGCKGQALPLPFVSKRTSMVIEIEAAGNINPTAAGRASPLVLKLYHLQSPAVFNQVDFLALYDADERTLGKDLVRKEEVVLQPNEKRTLAFEPPAETRAIGMFAVFRNYERAQWRAVAVVRPHKANVVRLDVRGTNLTMR